jgi:hypothetical protein
VQRPFVGGSSGVTNVVFFQREEYPVIARSEAPYASEFFSLEHYNKR